MTKMSPAGTKGMHVPVQPISFAPTGLGWAFFMVYPAMNRWAYFRLSLWDIEKSCRSCAVLRKELSNVPHDLCYALLFLQDVGGELGGWQVGDVFLGARVLAVEVAAVGENFDGWNSPSPLMFFPLLPP